ncbi:MAG: hypothetical protein G5Z42_02610 [Caldisphaeraceae archaeon]|nr:hypothetical protein [Caldisphaeraceae archaeon]MEB3797699.1 hypothetical protein [Caldisphaeraceae archaeon]
MTWFKKFLPRIIFAIAVSLIAASAFASYYGIQTRSEWSITYSAKNVPSVVSVILPSSTGIAKMNITGASKVIYLNISGNPLTLLGEAGGLGLKAVNTITHSDLKTGVYYIVTGVEGNPITIEEAFQSFVKNAHKVGNSYLLSMHLKPQESLVAVALPSSSIIVINEAFKVTGYGRISLMHGIEVGVILIIISLILELIGRKAR